MSYDIILGALVEATSTSPATHVLIWTATIAAIPATIAALAAWRSSAATGRRVKTANGQTLGQMAEANSGQLQQLIGSFDTHCKDSNHRFERIEDAVFCPIKDTDTPA